MLAALLTNPKYRPPESSKVPFPNSQLARHHERLLKEDEELMELLTMVLISRAMEE